MTEGENSTGAANALPEDAERTLHIDSGEAFTERSTAEWRSRFDVSEGKELSEYGELQTLGIGGMGVVFEAEDPALKRPVALKLLRPQFRGKESSIESLIREARITAQIDHPNIVSVHRFGFFDGVGVYFTMKRVQGRTLKSILSKIAAGKTDFLHRYTLRHLVQIFISVCNGIAAAHERGFLHCDLKPANIMVGKFGQVFVMDWGIAKEISPAEKEAVPKSSPESHPLEGTPVFMAPELVTGEISTPDRQSDLYSLGAILWCILTKREAPFDPVMASDELLPLIAQGVFPAPSHCAPKGEKVPAELEAIVLKAMNRDRKKRYADVTALLVDLHHYLDGFPVTAYSPNVFYRTAKLIRRRPLVPLTLLAALLTAGIFSGTLRIIEYVNNRTMFVIAHSDFIRSVEGLRKSAHRLQHWRDNGKKMAEMEREKRKQQLLFELRNASVDLFDAFNIISRFAPAEQRRFLLSGGGEAFRKLLLLQLEYEPEKLAFETAKRFQRQYPDLFRLAQKCSPQLERLIFRIRSRSGILRVECDSPWKCLISRPGERDLLLRDGGGSVELPAGEYKVRFIRKDGTVFTKNIQIPLGRTVFCSPPPESKSKTVEKRK